MNRLPRIALVFKTRLEENIAILNAISKYNRFHEKWSAYIDDQAIAQKDPEWLMNKAEWDGIVCKHSAPELLKACLQRGIPAVDLSDDAHHFPGIPKIRPDNHAVGHMGAEHFIERGFRNFAFCGFSSEVWAVDRRAGFEEAVSLNGGIFFSFENEYPKISTPGWESEEENAISEWIAGLPKPVAVMACNDLRGLQVIHACRMQGLQVPQEVAVLGANNESLRCELSFPQLSSIPLNTEFYGQKAAEWITSLILGEPIADQSVFVEPCEVVTRRSTDFLAIDDPMVVAALSLIKDRACKGISVEDITHVVHVSRSVLERRFRKYLGRSPQAEIRSIQIHRIKELLRETDYTLAHIAELVGFEHPEYLCVVFKKATSMTPNQYRQKMLGRDGAKT
jgi:LacI family transcriptional regulator